VPEARAFLHDLTEHATLPPFVYSHKWKIGNLVMWDNHTVMHRVTPSRCDGANGEHS
jgi:alpha-ketoglutarate-dependent 2,4-dichlorophenoxyacetate dioxygenase